MFQQFTSNLSFKHYVNIFYYFCMYSFFNYAYLYFEIQILYVKLFIARIVH